MPWSNSVGGRAENGKEISDSCVHLIETPRENGNVFGR